MFKKIVEKVNGSRPILVSIIKYLLVLLIAILGYFGSMAYEKVDAMDVVYATKNEVKESYDRLEQKVDKIQEYLIEMNK